MELSTPHGKVPLRLVRGKGRGMAVIFPGLHYSASMPLLYYSAKTALYLGYDVLEVNYDLDPIPHRLRGEFLKDAAHVCLAWAQQRAKQLLLIGKSAGTAALVVSTKMELSPPVARVWLTPLLNQAPVVQALAGEKRGLAILAEGDPAYSPEAALKIRHPGLDILTVEQADHRLELADPLGSVDVLRGYVRTLISFVQATLA